MHSQTMEWKQGEQQVKTADRYFEHREHLGAYIRQSVRKLRDRGFVLVKVGQAGPVLYKDFEKDGGGGASILWML